jgi:hypothetical protein
MIRSRLGLAARYLLAVACNRFTLFLDSKERVDLLHSTAEVETAVCNAPFPFCTNILLAVDTAAPPPEDPIYRDSVHRAVPVLLDTFKADLSSVLFGTARPLM